MKKTYLIKKKQTDGSVQLTIVSYQEWRAVVDANKGLPEALQRHFIREYIFDRDVEDCIYIEASFEQYRKWRNEHMRADRKRRRNRKSQQPQEKGHNQVQGNGMNNKPRILSLDAPVAGGNQTISLGCAIPDTWQMEEAVCSQAVVDTLRSALSAWQPWANELLDYYLRGEQRSCTNVLAEKYGVSPQMVRKYKKQFEDFIKKFFDPVSF